MGILSAPGLNCNAQEQPIENPEPGVATAEDVRRELKNSYYPVYEDELRALTATDTLYLMDRKNPDFTFDPSRMTGLSEDEKRIVTEAYAKGGFEVMDYNCYDEQGRPGFISGTGIIAHGDPSPPPPDYAYFFVTADKKRVLPYNRGCFRVYDTRYTVTIGGERREKVDAIIRKYCPDSFSEDEMY